MPRMTSAIVASALTGPVRPQTDGVLEGCPARPAPSCRCGPRRARARCRAGRRASRCRRGGWTRPGRRRRPARRAPRGRTGCRRCGRAARPRTGGGHVGFDQRVEQVAGRARVERIEVHEHGVVAPGRRRPALGHRWPGRGDQHEALAAQAARRAVATRSSTRWSAQCRSDRTMTTGRSTAVALEEGQHGPGRLFAGALRIDLAQRDLVAHQVEQAGGDPLHLGARRASWPGRAATASGALRLGVGQRGVGGDPAGVAQAPRRSATTRWPRRRARSGPRARARRAGSGPARRPPRPGGTCPPRPRRSAGAGASGAARRPRRWRCRARPSRRRARRTGSAAGAGGGPEAAAPRWPPRPRPARRGP